MRLVFNSADPLHLSDFWSGVTGYKRVVFEPDYIALDGDSLEVSQLVFVEVPDWKATPNRVRPDLLVDDLDLELERLQNLGAIVVEVTDEGRYSLLRDPEGNEFRVVERGERV